MSTGFDEAFRRVKELVATRCDGLLREDVLRCLDRQIDALGDVLYGLTDAEIKIVEGAAK